MVLIVVFCGKHVQTVRRDANPVREQQFYDAPMILVEAGRFLDTSRYAASPDLDIRPLGSGTVSLRKGIYIPGSLKDAVPF